MLCHDSPAAGSSEVTVTASMPEVGGYAEIGGDGGSTRDPADG